VKKGEGGKKENFIWTKGGVTKTLILYQPASTRKQGEKNMDVFGSTSKRKKGGGKEKGTVLSAKKSKE